MAEELIVRNHLLPHEAAGAGDQRGFVLVTSLVMLGLLTLMSLAMFYSGRIATQTSSTAQSSTEAYYYAETAVHYIAWALANNAEFDSHTYSGTYSNAPFAEPPVPPAPDAVAMGDYNELFGYMWDPGPTGAAGAAAVDTYNTVYTAGQLKYFDNSPICWSPTPADCQPNPPAVPSAQMKKRHICLQDATLFSNCVDVTVDPATRAEPSMNKISAQLPRYIRLDIAADGSITPTIPSLPHHADPVEGQDIPTNGAIVWLTAGDPNDPNHDIEIFPLDAANVYGGVQPKDCNSTTSTNSAPCPCTAPPDVDVFTSGYQPDTSDSHYLAFMAARACMANPVSLDGSPQSDDLASPDYLAPTDSNYRDPWLPSYSIVAYAIGYVNGKPSHMLRAVIQ